MTPDADIDDRIFKCEKILETDPNSQIFAALAEALRRKGELDRAFRVCQSGLRIHPTYGSAHIVMAKINLDRGMFDWAEAEVKRAIDIEGNSRTIELLLAEIYLYRGEFAQAIKLLRRLHLADPTNGQIKKLMEIAQRIPKEQVEGLKETPAGTAPSDTGREPAPHPTSLTQAELVAQAVTVLDVEGALFVNHEGLVVESEWASRVDPAACAAAWSATAALLQQELGKASFGQYKTFLIETGEYVFYVVRVSTGLFLLVGNNRLNLGTLRMKIASLIDM